MDKCELLGLLDLHVGVDAEDVARVFDLTYSAAAMSLMRLVRHDLATRYKDPDTQLYIYEITPKGEERLVYFFEGELDDC